MERLFRLFESWIDPFRAAPAGPPPTRALDFIWHFVRQSKGAFAAMLVLGGLVALVEAALFWFTGRLVDVLGSADRAAGWDGLIASNGPELVAMLIVVLAARTLIIVLNALVEEQTIGPGFFNLVRWQSLNHVSRQSYGFFQNDFAGRIATKVWDSGRAVGDFVIALLQVVWFCIVYSVTTIALIGDLDWRLAAIVVVWLCVFAALARIFVPRIRKASRATAEASAMVNGRLVDTYSNIQTLKLFGTDAANDAYMRDGINRFRASVVAFARGITSVRSSLAVTSGIMISAIAAVSIDLWMKGAVTLGAVAFTMGLVLRLNMLLGRMMTQLNGLMRNYGTIQNSMELISRPLDLRDKADAKPIAWTQGRVVYDRVGFHYGKGGGIIDSFSLTVAPGERIGLVGPSGGGKTTLVNLLLRLFDVEVGAIRIDGQDIRDVTQDSLRARFGVVTQEPMLLHRSIRDNIAYGNPGATEEQIVAAAKKARAHEFIVNLHDARGRRGYDAHVGERGVKLSGGQRQRIAIARVMLKDAPILILDEATSALDSEIEAAIQDNLYRLMEGKTVIAIAHRLSTIAALDRLVVIDRGSIAEAGTHRDLLKRGGLYARLWERQSGGFIAERVAAE